MSKLNYKTRGMSNPQGKPKVYFACHPDDFKIYFESLSEEILKKQNCAIWYDEGMKASYKEEELLLDLSGMQLFVIPVTSKFLYQDNRALNIEFRYAMKHHIPVLPIMQEAGLESQFNRVCGNLQFLDKNSRDMAAISYDEKLEKFLSSVLIGDELAKKVRAAFDAYIFLSYRKKDRKYAKKLMRLIHRNDFCRDIAIWYDEYLIPGEDFNEAIKAAMEKSRLFTLLVTSNLINEENYVMNVEYPEAKRVNKPIVPVEMEDTDAEELKKYYQGIPNCIKSEAPEELAKILTEHLKDIAIAENDFNPQHLFFIGLAYLGGVDVEVDHEKAVELIQSAAQAGLAEAAEKLVSMYRNGEGVERNYFMAICWQEKLVEINRKVYMENEREEDGLRLFFAQWYLGDYWDELGDLNEAKKIYKIMEKLGNKLHQKFKTFDVRRTLAITYEKLGDISQKEGNIEYAKDCYEKSLKIRREIAEKAMMPEAMREVAVSYNRLGDVLQVMGKIAQARVYYERSEEIAQIIVDLTGTLEAKKDLSITYERIGDTCRAEGRLKEAKMYYEQMMYISKEIANEVGSWNTKRDLAVSYHKLGDISLAESNVEKAKEYYEKCLDIDKDIDNSTGTIEAKTDLAISYESIGDVYWAEGELFQAKKYYEKSLVKRKEITEGLQTLDAKRGLSIIYNRLCNICRMQGELDVAKEYCRRDMEITKEIVNTTGTVAFKRDLSVSYNALGDISREEGKVIEAKGYYIKGLKVAKEIVEETGTVEAKKDLSISYNRLGDICVTEKDLSIAEENYKKALYIRKEIAEITGSVGAWEDLAYSYCRLGKIDNSKMNTEYLQCAYGIWKELSEKYPNIRRYYDNFNVVDNMLHKIH